MKNLSIGLFIILAFTSSAFAKLLFVPLDEAVRDSDLILIGTLTDIAERREEGATFGQGKIVVEQFIAGNVKAEKGTSLKSGDKLQLNYAETFACVMGSHKDIENEKGVFLLKLNDAGEIQYKDFRSIENLTEIKKLLKRGVKPNKEFKTIKIQKEVENHSLSSVETSERYEPKISFGVYSLERRPNYRVISVLLVILTSISLYYLLYRSRFKIR